MIMVSYIDKNTSSAKSVMMLTTMHDKVKVTNDQCHKSQAHVMHDQTKSGFDVVDLLSSTHGTRTKCKRWTINTLEFLLDTALTNGKTILKDNRVVKWNFPITLS